MEKKIPWVDLEPLQAQIRPQVLKKFAEMYDAKRYIQGPEDRKFEKVFASFCGVKYGCGVNSGLDSLQTVLKAWGIGPGDEVIVPADTYIASAMAATLLGAKPVLVDANLDDFNIDVSKIEAAITPRTKVIMPVHLFGQAADMDPIMAIAKKHHLKVLEDASQSHGALYKGKRTGSLGDAAGFSLYPGKNFGALGDSGVIVTNDEALSEKCHIIGDYGQDRKYHHCLLGDNTALDEIQAGILNIKLPYLDGWNEYRRKVADKYLKGITNPKITLPIVHEWATPIWHVFALRCKERDALWKYLEEHNIGVNCHYPIPIHLQPAYANLGYKKGDFSVAEEISNTEIDIPMYYGIPDDYVDYIIDVINKF